MKPKSFVLFVLFALAFTGCLRPDASATTPPLPPPVPGHCLAYTDLQDENYPDTLFVLANCYGHFVNGASVALTPIAPFDAAARQLLPGSLHYAAGLSGALMRVATLKAGQTPVVGYEYQTPQNKQINYRQLTAVEQNLQYVLVGSGLTGSPATTTPASPEEGNLPPLTLPPLTPPEEGNVAAITAVGEPAEPSANIDLEKLTANLLQAVAWYETIRPLLANIATQSASEADNTVVQILDITLKPLAATVKEVNGIVNSVQGATTAEQKAQYTTEAALRIQQSTAALQTYLWTLIYKKIDTKTP